MVMGQKDFIQGQVTKSVVFMSTSPSVQFVSTHKREFRMNFVKNKRYSRRREFRICDISVKV
jgi:hypothetical protein